MSGLHFHCIDFPLYISVVVQSRGIRNSMIHRIIIGLQNSRSRQNRMESPPSTRDILLPVKGLAIFATETMMERPRSSSVVRFKGTGINDTSLQGWR